MDPGAGARSIAMPVTPEPGESLPGYLMRVSDLNVLGGPHDLLAAAGITGSFDKKLPTLVRSRMRQLAATLRIAEGDLKALIDQSYPKQLPTAYVDHTRRRIAPRALVRSGHHRAIWMLRPFDFCPESWELLLARCPVCRVELRWTAPRPWLCTGCGDDLRRFPMPKVAREFRRRLSQIVNLVRRLEDDPQDVLGRLPNRLAALSGSELFQLIVIVGRALAKEELTNVGYRDLAAGASAVRKLDAVFKANSPRAKGKREPAFFRRFSSATETAHGELKNLLEQLTEQHKSREKHIRNESGIARPRVNRVARPRANRIAQGALTATEVASKFKIDKSLLSALVEAGAAGDGPDKRVPRRGQWFFPENIQAIEAVLSERISAASWGKDHDASQLLISQLEAEGLIGRYLSHSYSQFYDEPQLNKISVDGFIDKLALASTFTTGDYKYRYIDEYGYIPADKSFMCIGGMHKPWPILLKKAIANELPDRLRFRSRCLSFFWGALIPLLLHERLRHAQLIGKAHEFMWRPPSNPSWHPLLSLSEVHTYLNANVDSMTLDEAGIPAEFVANKIRFPRTLVEQFGSEYISSIEVGALLNRSPISAFRFLKARGLQRHFRSFWKRREVLANRGELIRPLVIINPAIQPATYSSTAGKYDVDNDVRHNLSDPDIDYGEPMNRLGLYIPRDDADR